MNSRLANDKSDTQDALTVNLLLKPVKKYLDDDDVTEITINEPGGLWFKANKGWEWANIPELDESSLSSLITAVYAYNNMKEASIGSLLMPDGSRCQITRPPATIDCQTSFTVRKHSKKSFTLTELHKYGAFDSWKDVSINQMSKEDIEAYNKRAAFSNVTDVDANLLILKHEQKIVEFLKQAVLTHKNIVIAGKTGSGKTTFAKALITKIPTHERLITIEDVHELHLPNHPNHLHMMFGSAVGRVSAFDALASCMRLSPDRILLAELRGDETWEYLQSLNTGHPGGITTVHANGALHTFERIASLVKSSSTGRTIELDAIKLILYTTIDVVLYFEDRQLKEVFFDPIYAKEKMNS